MYLRMARRLLLETDKRLLWKLAYNFGFKGMMSVQRFKRRMKRGEFFPPFLYISIINSCNLRCQGCWVDVSAKQQTIAPEALHKLIAEASGNTYLIVFVHLALLLTAWVLHELVTWPQPIRAVALSTSILVPLSLALLHQAMAMLVLTTASVHAANAISRRRVIEIMPRGRSRAGVLPMR